MFNISSSEFLLIFFIAAIFISPKHLPIIFYQLGTLIKKIRIIHSKFSDSIAEVAYEADPSTKMNKDNKNLY